MFNAFDPKAQIPKRGQPSPQKNGPPHAETPLFPRSEKKKGKNISTTKTHKSAQPSLPTPLPLTPLFELSPSASPLCFPSTSVSPKRPRSPGSPPRWDLHGRPSGTVNSPRGTRELRVGRIPRGSAARGPKTAPVRGSLFLLGGEGKSVLPQKTPLDPGIRRTDVKGMSGGKEDLKVPVFGKNRSPCLEPNEQKMAVSHVVACYACGTSVSFLWLSSADRFSGLVWYGHGPPFSFRFFFLGEGLLISFAPPASLARPGFRSSAPFGPATRRPKMDTKAKPSGASRGGRPGGACAPP